MNKTDPDGMEGIDAFHTNDRGFDAFSAPYKSPWFWVEAGLAAYPGARLGAEAVETMIAVNTSRKIINASYKAAQVSKAGRKANVIGTEAHKLASKEAEQLSDSALKRSAIYKDGKVVKPGPGSKGGAEIDAPIVTKSGNTLANVEYKTGARGLEKAQRARIMAQGPKTKTWFGEHEAPVFEVKPHQ